MQINQIHLADIIPKLPDILEVYPTDDFDRNDDLFLCALGFEERCLSIPRIIAESKQYHCKEALYFEYSTNRDDNEVNREELENYLQKFCSIKSSMPYQSGEFSDLFRKLIARISLEGEPKITFDISSCTSQLIITILKILFEFDVNLQVVYSEADIYHPIIDEKEHYISQTVAENISLTKGVSTIFIDQEFSGCNIDGLPEALIIFATFTIERTLSIISYVDESLHDSPKDRIIWIIGIPHLQENRWRVEFLKEINKISDTTPSLNISTFNYKDTISNLEKEYQKLNYRYHLNIAPLGSKMQSLGISIFNYFHPDVTIIFAPPKEYGSKRYTEGTKNIWKIDFGEVKNIRMLLDEIGMIEIVNNS